MQRTSTEPEVLLTQILGMFQKTALIFLQGNQPIRPVILLTTWQIVQLMAPPAFFLHLEEPNRQLLPDSPHFHLVALLIPINPEDLSIHHPRKLRRIFDKQ